MGVTWSRIGPLLAVLMLAVVPLTACAAPGVCSAVGYVSGISIGIAPDRISTLALDSLSYRACQDGECREGPLKLLPLPTQATPATPGGSAPAIPSRIASADATAVERFALVAPPAVTTSPVDLTVSGRTTHGEDVGPLHATIAPKVDYPDGPNCGQRITATAHWDLTGLHP